MDADTGRLGAARDEQAERLAATHSLAAAVVLVALAGACVAFWVAVPLGFLWALGQATENGTTHLVVGLIGAPAAMAFAAPFLFWLNALYLRISGYAERLEEDAREAGWHRRLGGPLEPMLLASLGVALIAMAVWFFVFAENPPPLVW